MKTPNDRDIVLRRIAEALGRSAGAAGPPDEWSAVVTPSAEEEAAASAASIDPGEHVRRFAHECALVGGETRLVERPELLDAALAAFATERGIEPDPDLRGGEHGYAVLRAQALLADTGSALVIETDAERRLAPYLPRTCVIVADAADIYPTFSAASMSAAFSAARRGDRGEALLITGPSRTADIEKTLVLGAHGPKALIVFITGVAPTGP